MLCTTMLSVVMLKVIKLNVIMLSVVAPINKNSEVGLLNVRVKLMQQSMTQYTKKIVTFLVTPKAGTEHGLLFNKLASEVVFEHLSPPSIAQQSVTKFILLQYCNLVTITVGVKHELLFNKPASELDLLTNVTQQNAAKFIAMINVNFVTPRAGAKQEFHTGTVMLFHLCLIKISLVCASNLAKTVNKRIEKCNEVNIVGKTLKYCLERSKQREFKSAQV
jgi:hypothetical protein